MRATARLSSLIAVVLLAGCAVPAERPAAVSQATPAEASAASESPEALEPAAGADLEPPPPDRGRIYFYRSDLPLMVALAPEIIVNGRRVGTAGYETVFHRDAYPGRYEIFLASDPDEPLYVTLAPGELRFVKTVVDIDLGGAKLSAELVEEAEARREIAAQRWARSRPRSTTREPS